MVQSFPTVAHVSDPFADFVRACCARLCVWADAASAQVANLLGLLFTLFYLWPVTRLVRIAPRAWLA